MEHFLAEYEHVRDAKGRRAIVRNDYLPKRKILTGLGPVEIRVAKTRDRSRSGIVFRSSLLPPYIKLTKSVENVLPWLYLKRLINGCPLFKDKGMCFKNHCFGYGVPSGTMCRKRLAKDSWISPSDRRCARNTIYLLALTKDHFSMRLHDAIRNI